MGTVFRSKIGLLGYSHRVVERRVKELYTTEKDVQMKLLIFFNLRFVPMLKTWYTFHKFHNRYGRWIEVPLRTRFSEVHSDGW